jgi:hypothetical protein
MESVCNVKMVKQRALLENPMDRLDIGVLEKCFRQKYGVRISETAEGLWDVEIKLEGEDQVYGLVTSHGALKPWCNLSSAIAFAKENCSNAGEVLVDIYGWRLLKLLEPAGSPI